jgi:ribosomal protein S18 acetylase RimI-like enzyme
MKLEGQAGGLRFTIRAVDAPREEQAILAVYRACEDFLALGPVAVTSLEMVRADLAHSRQEGGLFCGIYNQAGGMMLGVVDFVSCGYRGDPGLAFLALLMIAAPWRSRGLGEQVVHAVEAHMRGAGGASTVESGVQVNNPAAIRFWQRLGFRIVSPATRMDDGTTAYALRKDLRD